MTERQGPGYHSIPDSFGSIRIFRFDEPLLGRRIAFYEWEKSSKKLAGEVLRLDIYASK
jgi:hypothetical protein